MDTYHVNHSIFNFAAASINAPLKVCELKKAESVSVPLATVHRFEQDTRILTMVGSFLDCSGVTLPRLLEEVSLNEGVSEGTRQFMECSLSWSAPEDELSVICSVVGSHWIAM